LDDARPNLFPGQSRFRVRFELRKAPIEFGFQFIRDRQRVGDGGEAVPDQFDQPQAVCDGQFKDFCDGEMRHE
jgi:hypothetical protein